MQKFVIIGPGRLGTALALALQTVGHSVLAAHHPHPETGQSQRFTALTGRPVLGWTAFRRELCEAEVVLITVPDKAVTSVAQTLADSGELRADQIVVHTAGSLGSDALAPVRAVGAAALSLHPLQTIADPSQGPVLFQGTYFTLEGDETTVERATPWVEAMGGVPVTISAAQKPLYHAAAVLASNAVVALVSVAAELSGLDAGVAALLPLVQGAVSNLERLGLPGALTGPIDRGDFPTIECHLHALQNNPTALAVYAALGLATTEVAVRKGSLSRAERDRFTRLFQNILGGM